MSFLDVPELSTLASTCHKLASLAADPILQRTRLLVVAPSRVSHSLFGIGPQGSPLRPTVLDLINRGVMKGFVIERRWRAGLYLYSALACISFLLTLSPALIKPSYSLWLIMTTRCSCSAATRQMSYPLNCAAGLPIQTHSKLFIRRTFFRTSSHLHPLSLAPFFLSCAG